MKVSLKAARVNQDLTRDKAAKLIGVSAGTIERWENGKSSPKQKYFDKICDVYRVKYDDIIFLARITQNA